MQIIIIPQSIFVWIKWVTINRILRTMCYPKERINDAIMLLLLVVVVVVVLVVEHTVFVKVIRNEY